VRSENRSAFFRKWLDKQGELVNQNPPHILRSNEFGIQIIVAAKLLQAEVVVYGLHFLMKSHERLTGMVKVSFTDLKW
jgi:hypothetical protein